MRRASQLVCQILVLLVAGSSTAGAQHFSRTNQGLSNITGTGARALGMGGAFIAIADDATAASWNPAGLAWLVRPEMSVVYDYSTGEYDTWADRIESHAMPLEEQ